MNKVLLLAVTAMLVTGVVAALLWPDPHESGGPSTGTEAARSASRETDRSTPAAEIPALPSSPQQDGAALAQKSIESQVARIRERLGPEADAKYRKSLEEKYATLGKALELRPDEVNRILETLVRFQRESREEAGELLIRDITSGRPDPVAAAGEIRRRGWMRQQAQDAQLQAMLGSKFLQWETFNAAPRMRGTVDNLQVLFEVSGLKLLSAGQADSLVNALTAEQVRINRDASLVLLPVPGQDPKDMANEEMEWALRYTPEINSRLVLAASRHLEPQQLTAFRTMLENDFNRSIAAQRRVIAEAEGVVPGSAAP